MEDSLYFNDQHHAVREMVRSFAQAEVAPVASRLDEESRFPWENVKRMGELGLLGILWPEEVGGAGLDLTSYILAIHEMAKVDASHAITRPHGTGGSYPNFPEPGLADEAYYLGNTEQRRRTWARYDPDGLFAGPPTPR